MILCLSTGTFRAIVTAVRRLNALVILPVVFVASCDGDGNKYVDPGKTFALRYPDAWTASNEAGAAVFAEPGSGPRASLVVTRVPKKDGAIARTQASVLKNVMTQYAALAGFSLRRSEQTTLAGRKVHGLSVLFNLRGTRYRKDQYIVPLEQHLLVVDCNAPASAFDKELFSRLLAELEVIG